MVARLLVTLLLVAACDGAVPVDTGGEDPVTDAVDTETSDTETNEPGGDDDDSGAGGDDPDATPVLPTEADGRWTWAWTDDGVATVLTVDPAHGARIARLAVGGVEVLTDASVNATNWGATFWTSPQADWGWPPVAAIDGEPYAAALDGDTLVLTSGPAPVGDATLTVEKRVTVDTDGITLAYTVHNAGDTPATLAGWEVARVPTGGLTFFPGASVRSTVGRFPYEEQGGVVWFDGAAARDGDTKLVADGTSGWLAHVVDGVLLVKRAADVPAADQAPGEGEVELFAAADYVEVENQGPLTTIAPGSELTYTVSWRAVPVPGHVPVAVGSAALVTLAEATGR